MANWKFIRFQYSLKTLLFVSLVSGSLFGLVAKALHRAQRQEFAVAVIKSRPNWSITYDFQKHGHAAPPGVPRWLLETLGVDCFATVVGVSANRWNKENALGNNGVRILSDLPDLEEISIIDPDLSDSGIVALNGLTRLRSLRFTCCSIDGTGFQSLSCLKQLHALELIQCWGVTDEGLSVIGRMECLEKLDLRTGQHRAARFTNDGLKHLAGLKNLNTLDLGGFELNEAGFANIVAVDSLERLALTLRESTPALGVARLQSLPKLKRLCLDTRGFSSPPGKLAPVIAALAADLDDQSPSDDHDVMLAKWPAEITVDDGWNLEQ